MIKSTIVTAVVAALFIAGPFVAADEVEPLGRVLWAKGMTNQTDDSVFHATATDGAGNVYAVGMVGYDGRYEFGDGVSISAGRGRCGVVVKYDRFGVTQWASHPGKEAIDSIFHSVAVDHLGNVYAAGRVFILPSGYQDSRGHMLLAKFDTHGVIQWVRMVTDKEDQSVFYDVAVDGDGNIYAVGSRSANAQVLDFGHRAPGFTSYPESLEYYSAGALVKFDPEGRVLWSTSPNMLSSYRTVAVDTAGFVYVAGSSTVDEAGTHSFGNDVQLGVTPENDGFLMAKYDNSGKAQWVQGLAQGGTGNSSFRSIAIASDGSIYATGKTAKHDGHWDFGNGVTAQGNTNNGLVVKYDQLGTPMWSSIYSTQRDGGLYETPVHVWVDHQYVYLMNLYGLDRISLDGDLMWSLGPPGPVQWVDKDYTRYNSMHLDRHGYIIITGQLEREVRFGGTVRITPRGEGLFVVSYLKKDALLDVWRRDVADPNGNVRLHAILGLSGHGGREAEDILLKRLKPETNSRVRRTLEFAIRRLLGDEAAERTMNNPDIWPEPLGRAGGAVRYHNETINDFSASDTLSLVVNQDNDMFFFGKFMVKGSDGFYQPRKLLSNVKAVEVGEYFGLALKHDGTLWSIGDNSHGQLGFLWSLVDNSLDQQGLTRTKRKNSPTMIMENVAAIGVGKGHSMAVKSDGTLWTFGLNNHGQLGDGSAGTDRSNPARVLSDIEAVAGGNAHTLALKKDGTLWTFGSNEHGQLGDGTNEDRDMPRQVLTGVTQIAAEGDQSFAVRDDGSVWIFGVGFGAAPVRYAEHGISFSQGPLILKKDYSLWTQDDSGPIQITGNFQDISGGSRRFLALKDDGTLWNYERRAGDSKGEYVASQIDLLEMYVPVAHASPTESRLRVRSDAVLDAETLGHLDVGDRVEVLERSTDKMRIGEMNDYWYRVWRLSDGLTGWSYGYFLKFEE